MNFKTLVLAAVALPVLAASVAVHAQSIDVKGVDTSQEGSTTIKIEKGEKAQNAKWETQDGEADIEGEASATGKDAKAAWTKACNDWKKEIRADNKDNKVLSVNCGKSTCGGDAGSKVCSSKGTYKIKTKIE